MQQQQQHRQQESEPEGEDELHHEAEVIARARQSLNVEPAGHPAEAEEEGEGDRHHHEIGERCARGEQHGGCEKERQEGLLLARIEAGCDKGPQLVGDHREADHEAREQGHLQFDEEHFRQLGEDQLALPFGKGIFQWLDQNGEDLVGEIEAARKAHRERQQRAHEPGAQLDQMVEQRRTGLVELLDVKHRRPRCAVSPEAWADAAYRARVRGRGRRW